MLDLFAGDEPWEEPLAEGATILRRFARDEAAALMMEINGLAQQAPFRHMVTPGGHIMSVAMSNCGSVGWSTNQHGYLYSPLDSQTGQPWPQIPVAFRALSDRASLAAGYPNFEPDACLINRYAPGTKLSLHQDKDEPNLGQPIVSVSLGLPAVFQFGGLQRSDPLKRVMLEHGDVVVWGGASRLFYHGILSLKPGFHPLTDAFRYNLTFRKAS